MCLQHSGEDCLRLFVHGNVLPMWVSDTCALRMNASADLRHARKNASAGLKHARMNAFAGRRHACMNASAGLRHAHMNASAGLRHARMNASAVLRHARMNASDGLKHADPFSCTCFCVVKSPQNTSSGSCYRIHRTHMHTNSDTHAC